MKSLLFLLNSFNASPPSQTTLALPGCFHLLGTRPLFVVGKSSPTRSQAILSSQAASGRPKVQASRVVCRPSQSFGEKLYETRPRASARVFQIGPQRRNWRYPHRPFLWHVLTAHAHSTNYKSFIRVWNRPERPRGDERGHWLSPLRNYACTRSDTPQWKCRGRKTLWSAGWRQTHSTSGDNNGNDKR